MDEKLRDRIFVIEQGIEGATVTRRQSRSVFQFEISSSGFSLRRQHHFLINEENYLLH